jgi:hypothetical protein
MNEERWNDQADPAVKPGRDADIGQEQVTDEGPGTRGQQAGFRQGQGQGGGRPDARIPR